MNRNTLKFFAIFAPVVLLAACGDGGTTGSAGSAGTAGKGGSAGSSGSSGSSGSAGTAGTGGTTGGSAGTGGTTGGTAGTGGSGGTMMMSGSGGSSMLTGQCLDDTDQAIIKDPNSNFQQKVTDCGKNNLAMEPATKECIKMIGFTDGCTTCFDDTVQCVKDHCLAMCLNDPNGQPCTDCRKMYCDGPFQMCSGLMP